jgi:hypothetical protein
MTSGFARARATPPAVLRLAPGPFGGRRGTLRPSDEAIEEGVDAEVEALVPIAADELLTETGEVGVALRRRSGH